MNERSLSNKKMNVHSFLGFFRTFRVYEKNPLYRIESDIPGDGKSCGKLLKSFSELLY